MRSTVAPIFKVDQRSGMVEMVRRWRASGATVAFTNGCFDILHHGHVQSIQDAASTADRLVVGLNSDASVRANKGDNRPIVSEMFRAMALAGVRGVDAVVIFDDATPVPLIELLKPDVHCKGADYVPGTGKPMPERAIVEGYGGRVVYLPMHDGVSTTAMIERIKTCQS